MTGAEFVDERTSDAVPSSGARDAEVDDLDAVAREIVEDIAQRRVAIGRDEQRALPCPVDESGVGQEAQIAPIRLPQAKDRSELRGAGLDFLDLNRHRPALQDSTLSAWHSRTKGFALRSRMMNAASTRSVSVMSEAVRPGTVRYSQGRDHLRPASAPSSRQTTDQTNVLPGRRAMPGLGRGPPCSAGFR